MAVWWNMFGFGEAHPLRFPAMNLFDTSSPKEKWFAFASSIFVGNYETSPTWSLSETWSWGRSASVRMLEYAAMCQREHLPNLVAV